MRPKPLEYGDQAHLVWGSIRWSIARQMRLAAEVGGATTQYVALLSGAAVVLTREQVMGLVPEARWPANVEDHAEWTLTGNDTLAPAS
jgi:hypothetical protein